MADISVIIPVKNRTQLLRATLDNLLSQSKLPDEIIVVDDHSDEDMKPVIFDYITDCIFLNNKGKGPGAARNLGLSVATGRYIQFFDSDDLCTTNKLEVQFNAIKKSGADIAYGPYVPARQTDNGWEQTDVVMQNMPFGPNHSFTEWILRGWNAITQSCLFRKTLVDAAGPWNEQLITHEDYLYLFKLSLHNPTMIHVPDGAVLYRQHGSQSTDNQTHNQSRAKDKMEVLIEMTQQLNTLDADFFSKICLKGRLAGNYRYLKKTGLDPRHFSGFIGAGDWLADLAYRLYNKQMRSKTGTAWEPMHGVSSDPALFKKIISQIEKR